MSRTPSTSERSTLPVSRHSGPVSSRMEPRGGGLAARPPRAKQDGAAGDVAAEQQPLRPAQHFHRFEIQHVHDDRVVDAEIHAVHEHAHGRVDGRDGTGNPLPANGEVGDALARADAVEGDVGHGVAEIFEVGDVPLGKRFLAQHGDCHGDALGTLGSAFLAGGGDHFLDQAASRCIGNALRSIAGLLVAPRRDCKERADEAADGSGTACGQRSSSARCQNSTMSRWNSAASPGALPMWAPRRPWPDLTE